MEPNENVPTRTFDEENPGCISQPCNDCPWRKTAVPGWLGPYSAKRWIRMAHSDSAIACHKTIPPGGDTWEGVEQCAGAASFRANVAKRSRDPRVAHGPRREDVFQSNDEFVQYHTDGEEHWEPQDMWSFEEGEIGGA